MKKLTLDLDALTVDSFDVSPADRDSRGTVKGHDSDENDTWAVWCRQPSGITQGQSCLIGTCGASCQTCGYSCGGTCSNPTCFGDSCVCWTSPPYC